MRKVAPCKSDHASLQSKTLHRGNKKLQRPAEIAGAQAISFANRVVAGSNEGADAQDALRGNAKEKRRASRRRAKCAQCCRRVCQTFPGPPPGSTCRASSVGRGPTDNPSLCKTGAGGVGHPGSISPLRWGGAGRPGHQAPNRHGAHGRESRRTKQRAR